MTANNDKLLFALGLCRRSGALTCGTPLICTALRQKGKEKPLLVLVASDASEATRKKLTDKCAFYEVPLWPLAFSGETLASAVGKKGMLAAVAIAGENPTALVRKHYGKDADASVPENKAEQGQPSRKNADSASAEE